MKRKFLIIRLSSIGDIVLTTPLIRCLKKQVAGAEIHFVTKAKYRELLSDNPHIDKLHFLSGNFRELLVSLRREKIDHVIDLHHNLRSLLIKLALFVPSHSFHKADLRKWLMVLLKRNTPAVEHTVERYFRTVSRFKVKSDGKGLDLSIPPGKEYDRKKLPHRFQSGYAAFIIGGTYRTKRLPQDKIMAICRGIKKPVILIGGKEEKETGNAISRNLGESILNLTGKITLFESASLVRHARVVLTNDTGMMHIASAFGKKILSFWGNTVPGFGMFPYMPHPASSILQVEGLRCRPCSKLGYNECPRKHFRCMNDMDSEKAIRWVEENF